MRQAKFNKTGHEFDARNERDYNALTKRIEKGLIEIEVELTSFQRKPTQKDLANKSNCSIEIIILRSKKNAQLNPIFELDENGFPLKDKCGKSICVKQGWPLTELTRIQRIYKAMREAKKMSLHNNGNEINQRDSQLAKNMASAEHNNRHDLQLSNLRGENAQLKYETLNLKEIITNKNRSIKNMEARIEALEKDNTELLEEVSMLKVEIQNHKKRILSVARSSTADPI